MTNKPGPVTTGFLYSSLSGSYFTPNLLFFLPAYFPLFGVMSDIVPLGYLFFPFPAVKVIFILGLMFVLVELYIMLRVFGG